MSVFSLLYDVVYFMFGVSIKEGRKEGTCLFDINNHNTE